MLILFVPRSVNFKMLNERCFFIIYHYLVRLFEDAISSIIYFMIISPTNPTNCFFFQLYSEVLHLFSGYYFCIFYRWDVTCILWHGMCLRHAVFLIWVHNCLIVRNNAIRPFFSIYANQLQKRVISVLIARLVWPENTVKLTENVKAININ